MNQGTPPTRKKVLFLITKATWGGAQRYVFDLATHLPQTQFDVLLVYGQGGRLQKMIEEKNIATNNLPALGRDIALLSDIRSFADIFRLLKRERPGTLHVNSSKAAALGVLAARLCGVRRIIFTVHGWPFKEERNSIARAAIYLISWFTAFLSHATIVVSKHDELIAKKMPFIGNKVHYVPPGIERPTFLSREEAFKTLSISTTLPHIVSIAELTKNKGIGYAIDAVALLKERKIDVEYFIIGDGELRAQLETRASARGVAEHIHFLGFVENAATYLKAFDVFVLPSIKEGMPYVLLEAAFADLPIVTTNVIDSEFSDDYSSVSTVKAGSPQQLAEAIEHAIITHPSNDHYPTLESMTTPTYALY